MIELPLTPAQERFWFLDRFDPGQPNNIAFARRLHGALDAELLARSFAAVSSRHEALRATFVERDGVAVQTVADPGEFNLELIDLTAEPETLRVDRAREIGRDIFDTRFDLARGPLLRAVLLQLGTDDHVLVVVAHHIIFDGSSQPILLADLATAYGGGIGAAGESTSVLTPPSVGWAEYVREQAEQPIEKAEQDLAYWRERLADPPTLSLPADRPRPLFKTPRSQRLRHDIDADLAGRLERLARAQRCTPFMLLLAAYQVLLGRHAGQDDVCVGSASAGRSRPELEPLVGCFVHTLVLRGNLSGDPTFADLLRRTRTAALEAYAHQEIAFERLVSELDVARDVSRTPLFETMFVLHTQDRPEMDILPGVSGAPFTVAVVQTLFDLVLDVWFTPKGLNITARYDTGVFAGETIEAFLRRYELLLRSIVEGADQRLSALSMQDPRERQQLIARGQGPRRQYAGTVSSLFAARAAASPQVPAVGTSTYGELDARANQIARHLREQGVSPGSVVAVCLERTSDLIAALLGVWRCGAAYLPLDPGLPAARMDWLCADAGVTTVLTQRALTARPQRVVWLDEDVDTIAAHPTGPLDTPDDPAALAYLLYTSGSTGRPKGVEVAHAALTNLLLSMRDTLGSRPADVWLALTSLSFDISGLELFLPLVTGGRIVMVPDDLVRDGIAITRMVTESGVTHVQATPSGWRMLLDAGFNAPAVTGLTGGEALPARLARELRPRLGRLFNVYGPTETTIWSTATEIVDPSAEISLGGPIANTQIYVVDAAMRPVPVGVPGELLIGGDGVAWGYRGRPALTAQRFRPDPYGPPGARVYHTGDRVRWLRGGGLEYLGRADAQVKLRGYRIELGEIEARLSEHPAVNQAAVIVSGEDTDARLVGYVTGKPGSVLDGRELRSYLGDVLPAYMVPGQIVVLEQLPLNTAGKIDRRGLPVAEFGDLAVREFVAPRGEIEELVAATWGEVLRRDRVGASDDFFDIGGHSLLATKVVSRIGAGLGLEVPIRSLFIHSTVEEFAAAVEELLVADVARLSDDDVARLLGGTA